jgi:hypothetical protein
MPHSVPYIRENCQPYTDLSAFQLAIARWDADKSVLLEDAAEPAVLVLCAAVLDVQQPLSQR